jgi:hypothetical protein
MAIFLGGTIINKKLLGVNKLNKIMLGAMEVFPNFAGAFTPADLFKDGSKGFWYDLTDLSTLFQDAAGTIPVTAAGQPIGMLRDKSGSNNHLTQTNNAKRPLYGTSGPYARMIFDGLTSAFKTAPFAMGSDKFTLFAGYANDKDTGTGTLAEFSPNYLTNAGSFAALIPSLSTSRGSFGSNGGSGGGEKEVPTAPQGDLAPRVFTCYNDFATDDVANGGDYGCDYIRANGQPVTGLIGAGNSVVGAGPYGTHSLFVGARNETSNYLGGYIYQLVGVGKTCTDDERSKTEQFIYQRIPTPIITVVGEFPAMTVGTPITPFTFTAVGGTSPYTFTEIEDVPHGLTLASNGQVSGTPTIEGAYSTIIEAVDALGFTGDRLYTGTVAPAAIDINIIGDFPANMTTGIPIDPFSFTASGGTGPYTFSVVEDAMPTGLTLASNGEVSGTPTVHGPYSVVIDATDALANNGYKLFEGHVLEATGWTPYDLFGAEDKGAWYDLDDNMDEKIAFRRNLLLQSEVFNISPWASTAVPTLTADTPPTGYNQVFNVPNGVVNGRGRLRQSLAVVAGTTYCFTSVLKVGAEPRDIMLMGVNNYNSFNIAFNLATGTITTPPPGASNGSIVDLGDGWFKVSLQFTAHTTVISDFDINFGGSDLGSTTTMSFLHAGAQVEVVSELGTAPTPTAYQKVTNWNTEFLAQYPNHALFQAWTGTTPVTNVEQPVGLVLDKSKGLALDADVLLIGGFSSATGWSLESGMSISGGKCILTNAIRGGGTGTAYALSGGTVAGRRYRATITIDSISAGAVRLQIGGVDAAVEFTTPGTHSVDVTATGAVVRVMASSTINTTAQVDNLIVQQIAGNHLTQATAAKRPLYQSSGGLHWLKGDGIDDWVTHIGAMPVATVVAGVYLAADAPSLCGFWTNTNDGSVDVDYAIMFNSGTIQSGQGAGSGISDQTHKWVNGVVNTNFPLGSTGVISVDGTGYSGGLMQFPNGAHLFSDRNLSRPHKGNAYQLVSIDRILAAQERADTEQFIANKMGVVLP